MLQRHWPYLLLLFLLADLGYSGWQYFQFPIDGDLTAFVGPSAAYTPVLHDPFGLRVLLHHEAYPAPNRFFAHLLLFGYFRHVPLLLQKFLSPVDSLYAAAALLKLAVHALLVYVLAVAIGNSRHVLGRRFLLAAALVTPLLQACGYNGQMGVLDWSITYTAFYALPVSLLLLFFLPFVREALHGKPLRLSVLSLAALLGLAVVLAFNGPIIPPSVLIICLGALLLGWLRRLRALPATTPPLRRAGQALGALPTAKLSLFLIFSALSLYSLYIGQSNSENSWASISLAERYARLPLGVFYQLTGKLGLPLLLLMLLVNAWLISRRPATPLGRQTQRALQWLGVFSLIFILLLPLGGYRAYREYIIRRDTILPILVGLIGYFALSSYYLLTHLPAPARRRYTAVIVVFLGLFTITDKPRWREFNACQRRKFAALAASPAPVVRLPADCPVLDWKPATDSTQTALNGQMLHYWRITPTPKRYYQQ